MEILQSCKYHWQKSKQKLCIHRYADNIVILKNFNKMKLINIMLILLKIKIFSIREKDKLGKSLYKGTFELEISNWSLL